MVEKFACTILNLRAAPVLHRFTKIEQVEQKFGSSPAVYKSNCGARMVIKEIKRSSILSSPSWTRGIHVWVTVCCWFFYCSRFDSSAEVDFKKIPERFDWCSVQIGCCFALGSIWMNAGAAKGWAGPMLLEKDESVWAKSKSKGTTSVHKKGTVERTSRTITTVAAQSSLSEYKSNSTDKSTRGE